MALAGRDGSPMPLARQQCAGHARACIDDDVLISECSAQIVFCFVFGIRDSQSTSQCTAVQYNQAPATGRKAFRPVARQGLAGHTRANAR